MASPLRPLRAARYLHRWRKLRKEGHAIPVDVSDPVRLLREMEDGGIPAMVLRDWDAVGAGRPISVLTSDDCASVVANAAADMTGDQRVEFFSVAGEMGNFGELPVYPPAFAAAMLDARTRHDRGFSLPAPRHRVPMSLFHACYRLAESSGLPTGVGLSTGAADRDVGGWLRRVAQAEGESLPTPLTLESIHADLQRRGWDMQLDLLARWPLQSPWITHLLDSERARYAAISVDLPYVIVFVFREDVSDEMRALAHKKLGRWFDLLEHGELDANQRRRCERHLRGGNWYGRRGRETRKPTHYAICNDPSPEPVTDPELLAKQPHMTNERVGLKYKLRDQLRAADPNCHHVVHTSDNPHETMHFLEVIFGDRFEAKVAELSE